jgi:hypothetical protein
MSGVSAVGSFSRRLAALEAAFEQTGMASHNEK